MPIIKTNQIIPASIGEDVIIIEPCNIYGCNIGDQVRIGPFVEIQQDVYIGNKVKIGSHTFICASTRIMDECFIGHGVMFCNDKRPRSTINGMLKGKNDWKCESQWIDHGASIGTGAIILPGVYVGKDAMVAAGAVVTKNIPAREIWAGNPAKKIGEI